MKSFLNQLIEDSKTRKIRIFFDMDGVCSEEICDPYDSILVHNNEEDFYFKKRPLKTVIKAMKKLNKQPNIELYILSSCDYENQADQKRRWLKLHVPFMNLNNAYFVVWKNTQCKESERPLQKALVMEKLNRDFDGDIYLIEDRHSTIIATNDYFGKLVAFDMSRFIP